MKRRNALKNLTLIASGSIAFSTSTLFSACQSETYQPLFFTKKDIPLLNEIGETILPETSDSPGAKAQKVANFMDVYVADCYSLDNQKLLQDGLLAFSQNCQEKFGKSFLKLTQEERHKYLVELDDVAKQNKTTHYFSLLKSLVLFAYFTSKDGAEKALRYVPIPEKYVGNYPYQKGDKAWAI